jgi:23S rRNA (guanosine2251-2'-O)-methyltransferase
MAGNSQRKGAMRNPGTKKGPTVGTGGARRKGLQPKGPTPKATERPHHPAARRERAAARRADEAAGKKINSRTGVAPAGRASGPRKRPTADGGGFLMGRNSVVEALRAKIPAKALYVQVKTEADDRWREALKLATAFRIPIMEVTRTDLDRMTDGGVHQGLVLSVPAYEYTELDELKTATVLVALDGVTDPRNLGAIARSAAAFGAGGIVIPSRRSTGVTPGAWKTSAGALSRVPVAQVTNLTRALQGLQKAGYTVIGLAANSGTSLQDLDPAILGGNIVIVVGSEGQGLGRLVSETCDWLVGIDMDSKTESLNAAVATSIALHAASLARR